MAGRHVVRRKLSDGSYKEYSYERKRNLPDRIDRALIERPDLGTIQHHINAFQHSPEWRAFKPATQLHYARYLGAWERIPAQPIADISRRQIFDIRDKIAEGAGNAAANNFIRATAAWFSWMLSHNQIEYSPAARMARLPAGKGYPAWSDEQFNHAVHTFPEHLRRAIILARYTGQRRGDLIAMRWSDYRNGMIHVTQQKGRLGKDPIKLVIPVHSTLLHELDMWKADAAAVTILVSDTKRPWGPDNLSRAMKIAVTDAHLPPGLNMHGFRKLAATTLAELGCSPHQIAAITGHTSLAMVEHYTRSVSQEKLAKEAIDRWERKSSFTGPAYIHFTKKGE